MLIYLFFAAIVIAGVICFDLFGLIGGTIVNLLIFGTIWVATTLVRIFIGDPAQASDRENR
jgi:hypothetical protein